MDVTQYLVAAMATIGVVTFAFVICLYYLFPNPQREAAEELKKTVDSLRLITIELTAIRHEVIKIKDYAYGIESTADAINDKLPELPEEAEVFNA